MVGTQYVENADDYRWDDSFPLIRNAAKCVTCLRCVQVCDKIQTLKIWDVKGSGSRTTVGVRLNREFTEADCALCGQCITHCPTGALSIRDDTAKVAAALEDPDITTVVQVAPSNEVCNS